MVVYAYLGTVISLIVTIFGIVNKELPIIFFGLFIFSIGIWIILKECSAIELNKIIMIPIIIFLLIGGLVTLVGGINFKDSKSNLNKDICLSDYSNYNLKECLSDLEGIKTCEKINATFIKFEGHLFSSPNYICEKAGKIIRI